LIYLSNPHPFLQVRAIMAQYMELPLEEGDAADGGGGGIGGRLKRLGGGV
jgi:hypothetical protein